MRSTFELYRYKPAYTAEMFDKHKKLIKFDINKALALSAILHSIHNTREQALARASKDRKGLSFKSFEFYIVERISFED